MTRTSADQGAPARGPANGSRAADRALVGRWLVGQLPSDPPVWRGARRLSSPSREPASPARPDLAQWYATKVSINVDPLPRYATFGALKLAAVLAGVLARVRAGTAPASVAEGSFDGFDVLAPLVVLGRHVPRAGLV